MTRINVVPVECLTDKHLLAEYKEITRPFNKVIARRKKGTLNDVTIPPKYCLGAGHETFFFNKLRWLMVRYHKLYGELNKRGFNISAEKFHVICGDILHECPKSHYNDWKPTPDDMYLNMARLSKRSNIESVLNELNKGD